jgi:hypothetical protein
MIHQNDLTPDYVVREQVPRVWTGEERRGIDGMTLQLMAEMRAMLERHEVMEDKKFEGIKHELDIHTLNSERRHGDLVKRFDAMQQSSLNLLQANNQTTQEIHKMFKNAFPGGDAESHRRAHEAWMEKERSEREFWMHLKKQVVGWGLTAAIAWAAMLLWAGFLRGPLQ